MFHRFRLLLWSEPCSVAFRTEPAAGSSQSPMVADLALAVQHIHTRHVLHRDIKPSNVMLEWSGDPTNDCEPAENASLDQFRPKLTDFGACQVARAGYWSNAQRHSRRHARLHGAEQARGAEGSNRSGHRCVRTGDSLV